MRGAVAAAMCLALGCGSDPVPVAVTMQLDGDSCYAATPARVGLSCDASAGVWLRDGITSAVVDQACTAFSGEDSSLTGLPSILETIDLSGVSSEAVFLEVAVYSPWNAEQGCPPLDDEAGPYVVVSGKSPVTRFSDTTDLALTLFCGVSVTPPGGRDCDGLCMLRFEDCSFGIDPACDDPYSACFDECVGSECDVCDTEYQACYERTTEGACFKTSDECYTACGDDFDCQNDCDTAYNNCVATGCEAERTDCLTECNAPSCAAVAP